MNDLQVLADSVLDVAFPLEGLALPRDPAQALQQALCAAAPWLGTDTFAGVHPIKLVAGTQTQALISRRTRLLLRVSAQRQDDLIALSGHELLVGGERLRLGQPSLRPLQPHSTMYAYKVAADSADEIAFMAAVNHALAALGIGGARVCGKHQHMAIVGGVLDTFSLMLHALAPEQSLRLQQHGIGSHRMLGCGIFVPHKSAAAV